MTALTQSVATSAADKQMLVDLLAASREKFLSSFAGVAEGDCRKRPAEGVWSVLDCVEHIAGAESAMLRLVKETRRPRPAGAPNREQIFLDHMGSRRRKVQSPEAGQPKGRFTCLAEAGGSFETARAATIVFVEQNTEDLRATEVTHPVSLVGNVSCYEMMIIMARHAERHALQIEEIRNFLATQATAGGAA